MRNSMQQSESSVDCSTSDRIIIGLDYGTSGTGLSIYLVQGGTVTPGTIEWRSRGNALKVPSRIAYPVDNRNFSMPSPNWGFDIDPDMRAYSFTKLLLDTNVQLAEFDDQILGQTVSLDNPYQVFHPDKYKAPVHVVIDYLSHVLEFVWNKIKDDSFLSLPVDLRYSIPATWSEQGKNLSRHAVTQAWKFKRPQDTLTLTSEPEAAAESVYDQLKYNHMFQTGDGVLVCDCGSGTVDITTYVVLDRTGFNLSKITAIQGGKCGGAAIDSRLFDHMQRRLPEVAFDHLNFLIAPGCDFMTRFEEVKRSFGNAETTGPFYLPLPIRRGRGLCSTAYFDQEEERFILQVEDVRSLFDPVISNIIDLVKSQIAAAHEKCGTPVINKIALVWGLALSPYLQSALRQCFEAPRGSCIIVMPPNPIMAVSDGSALGALREDYAAEVRYPRYYGFGSPSPRGVRPCVQCMNSADHSNRKMKAQEIECVIVKGKRYQEGLVYIHGNTSMHHVYHDGDAKVMSIPVYSYELSSPLDSAGTTQFNDITLAGLIAADFSSLDLTQVNRRKDPHMRMLYRLDYLVTFIFDVENGTLRFTVEALGEVIGRMSLELCF